MQNYNDLLINKYKIINNEDVHNSNDNSNNKDIINSDENKWHNINDNSYSTPKTNRSLSSFYYLRNYPLNIKTPINENNNRNSDFNNKAEIRT